MDLPFSRSLRRSQKRRGYTRVDSTARTDDHDKEEKKKNNIRVPKRKAWRIKISPKIGFKMGKLSSTLKIWKKLKNGYVNMMLNLANDGNNVFGQKRIPKARQLPPAPYSPSDFENRLVVEIYKSLAGSRVLQAS